MSESYHWIITQNLFPLAWRCFLKFKLSSSFQHHELTYFTALLQAVADIIRTTLGPRSMLKMLLDATGGAEFFLYIYIYIHTYVITHIGIMDSLNQFEFSCCLQWWEVLRQSERETERICGSMVHVNATKIVTEVVVLSGCTLHNPGLECWVAQEFHC